MHRKRVTSELHDSYFRLMTIKHPISKIQLAIVWALSYLTQLSLGCKSSCQQTPRGLETRCGREGHTRPRGTSEPPDRGFSECPLGWVWLSLPHLVSCCLEFCWQLHRGVPRPPSVGCGLPYHILSLTLWESAGNCIGGFLSVPSVGCGFPYHISSLAVWNSAGNCIGGFRGPPRSGVAFPTTSCL